MSSEIELLRQSDSKITDMPKSLGMETTERRYTAETLETGTLAETILTSPT
jgi:hypothetical protein